MPKKASIGIALIVALGLATLAGPVHAGHPANSCLNVEPETDSNPTGTPHTITVTLRTVQGNECTGAELQPTENLTVMFEITGPNDPDAGNTPATADRQCNINKNSSSCDVEYTGTNQGTDTIVGWHDHDADGTIDSTEPQDTVTKTWTQGQPPPPPDTCPGYENDNRDQVVGTPGDDLLRGSPKDDIICGLGGNDTILGEEGNDLLLGGAGDDAIRGGDGDDELRGGVGHDGLFGDAGNDVLLGGRGNDLVNGGTDTDRCRGGRGKDAKARCES